MITPFVTVITPCHREEDYDNIFLNFDNQDYPEKELIVILDKGMTKMERECFILVDKGASIGKKRNMGCHMANGEIIVHMDSDDLYEDDWISKGVHFLLDNPNANITGLSRSVFNVEREGKTYLYEYKGMQPYVLGATMIYRRSAWINNHFKEISEGEDALFLANGGVTKSHNYLTGFIARITGNNTCSHKSLKEMRCLQ